MNLEDLNDVVITDPQAGHTLKKVAEGWVNQPACAKDEEPGVPEPPDDGNAYLRKYDEWIQHTDENNQLVGVPEAPEDGNTYGRKNAEWVDISEEDIDLNNYTKRNVAEVIEAGWNFNIPQLDQTVRFGKKLAQGEIDDGAYVAIGRQGKIFLEGGNAGALGDAQLTFSSQLTRDTNSDVSMKLTQVPIVGNSEIDSTVGLQILGGGMTFIEDSADAERLGLINITPRGLDIKSLIGSATRMGAIDFKKTDNLLSGDPKFDVRVRLQEMDITEPDDTVVTKYGLNISGNGVAIVDSLDEENTPGVLGRIQATPKTLDLLRDDGKPRIRFGGAESGWRPGTDAEIILNASGVLTIKAQEVKVQNYGQNARPLLVELDSLIQRLASAEAKIAALENS